MKKIKITSIALALAMIFTSIPVNANTSYSDSTHEVINIDTSITEDSNSNCDVYAELGSEFKVTIPKKITLDGTLKKGSYKVTVEGDIAGTETITVKPDSNFTLFSKNLPDVTAQVVQDKDNWYYNEILSPNNTIANGTILANDITAGAWSGTFNFNISLKNELISVSAFDENGNDLNASASLIGGTAKETLLNGLIESGYIEKSEEVDALINVTSDKFENLADTTFNVSNIANPGDTIVILHFNKETSEWEYIGTETVTENGEVKGNFTSYSPVAFIKVTENTFNHICNYKATIKNSTCSETGLKTFTCNCGKYYTETIPALEHNYINGICSCGDIESGTTYNYTYTGSIQTFTAPASGTYKLNLNGAQGSSTYATGGLGAFASGEIHLEKGEQIYITVGGAGNGYTAGFNGGSAGSNYIDWWHVGGGGGATDIRKGGTAISNRIIVAAGGGGGVYATRGAVLKGAGGNGNADTFLPVNVANTSNGSFVNIVSSNTLSNVYYNTATLHTASGTGGGGGYYGGRTIPSSANVPAGEGGTSYVGGTQNGTMKAGQNTGNGNVQIIYIKDTYTLTLDANGGNCTINEIQIVANNAYGKLPTPTKDGYTFIGWFTEKENGKQVNENTIINNNTTIYAQWKINDKKVLTYTNTSYFDVNVPTDGYKYIKVEWENCAGYSWVYQWVTLAIWQGQNSVYNKTDYVVDTYNGLTNGQTFRIIATCAIHTEGVYCHATDHKLTITLYN